MSRGRLAAELGVDKSLVGRWASGSVQPSPHNLERLTRFLATKAPGLTMLDWERDMTQFSALFGINRDDGRARQAGIDLPAETLEAVRNSSELRGEAYEGFWRATHPAVIAPGRFFHEHGVIRRGPSGLLDFEVGGPDVRYRGTLLPIEGQVFVIATDTVRHLPCFMIFNIVTMPKIILMDGILLTAGNAMRNPSAYPIVLERIGDLSGDVAVDDDFTAELLTRPQFVQDESCISDAMRAHLIRDFGPQAAAAGAELLLTATATPHLAQVIAQLNYGLS
ncbi:multiprotein-bridging factor 1 family protein [Brevundimonas sp.]|uniref:helix-turn-helix domain-containing protein n=1 Tax=Brevundimonas sp. TaxID=1871086 RepID=UPI003919695C